MISTTLDEISFEDSNLIIFFLKDYIYHSAYENILSLPTNISENLLPDDLIKIKVLLSDIRNSNNKNILLDEINALLYEKNEPNEKASNLAGQILKEIPIDVTEVISKEMIVQENEAKGALSEKFAALRDDFYPNRIHSLRRILKKGYIIKKPKIKIYTLGRNQQDNVLLTEIRLDNGVIINIAISESDFKKIKHKQLIISKFVVNMIKRDNRLL